MLNYRTPGTYFEWPDQRDRSLVPLRTDIAGFVGIAARGPLHTAIKVASWTQYVSRFGPPIPQGYLGAAVRSFFENGGRDCYIVRVADPETAACASRRVQADEIGSSLFSIQASSPGLWGSGVQVLMQRTSVDRFNLRVRLVQEGIEELWRNLPLTDDIDQLKKCHASLYVRFTEPAWDYPPLRLQRRWEAASARLCGGSDGLATLSAMHFSGEGSPIHDPWGLAALSLIDDISILAMPDAIAVPRDPIHEVQPPKKDCAAYPMSDEPSSVPELPIDEPSSDEFSPELLDCLLNREREHGFGPVMDDEQIVYLQQAMIAQCEWLQDRIALLDPPRSDMLPEAVIAWRQQFSSRYAALYYPWVRVANGNGTLRALPPSGAVAGICARVDERVGVHKSPANETVEAVEDVTFMLDDVLHGVLNDASVNVIRPLSGRGIRVMGARTLSDGTEWRYLSVRRLLLYIEEWIDSNTQWTVFEPSDVRLWGDISRVVTTFLTGLWRRGMLDGATVDEAFSVVCDATTNPPDEMARGRVVCQIGVQPPYPAEFVIVRIGRTQGGTEIIEQQAGG